MSTIPNSTGTQDLIPWPGNPAVSSGEGVAELAEPNSCHVLDPEVRALARTVIANSSKVSVASIAAGIKAAGHDTAGAPVINAAVDAAVPGVIASIDEAITEEAIEYSARKSVEAFQSSVGVVNTSTANLSAREMCCLL